MESAAKARPVLDRMLADVRAGRVQAVAVWALDRLHRSMTGAINTVLDSPLGSSLIFGLDSFAALRAQRHESAERSCADPSRRTAVVDALITFSGTAGGKPFVDVDIRVTRIWARQNGDWKCVEYQVTRVASPKSGS